MTRFFTRAEIKVGATPKLGGARPKALSLPLLHKMECKVCTLDKAACRSPKMAPTGSQKPLIYLLGEFPNNEDDLAGQQFVGRSGKLLRSKLPFMLKDQLRWNNCVRTLPPKEREPTDLEVECCRPSIIRDIEATKPKAIFGFGNIALNWALGVNGVQRWRGRKAPVKIGTHECWFYPMIHPAAAAKGGKSRDGNQEEAFTLDIKRACAELETLPDAHVEDLSDLYNGVTVFEKPTDVDSILEWLEWFRQQPQTTLDYETNRLRPYWPDATILTTALTSAGHTIAFPLQDSRTPWDQRSAQEITRALIAVLESGQNIVAHNSRFEQEWSAERLGVNLLASKWHCTQAQAYTLDERSSVQSLNDLCLMRFGFHLKKLTNIDREAMDRRNLHREPLGKILRYNALDTKFTEPLFALQSVEIEAEGLGEVYAMQNRRVTTFVKAQQRGIFVSQETVQYYKQEYDKQQREVYSAIQALPEIEIYRRLHGAFNPGATDDLVRMFRNIMKRPEGEQKNGKYSTDEEALEAMKDVPMARMVLDYRRVAKLTSTYIDPFDSTNRDTVVYPDGKLHTNFNSTFTDTGRTCVAGNTILETDQGSFEIQDLDPDVRVYRIRTHANRWKRITRKWFKGYEPMLRIEFDSGAYIECTARHKLLTPTGWLFARDLVIGACAISDSSAQNRGECRATSGYGQQQLNASIAGSVLCRTSTVEGNSLQETCGGVEDTSVVTYQHEVLVQAAVQTGNQRGVSSSLRVFEDGKSRQTPGTQSDIRRASFGGLTQSRLCSRIDSAGAQDDAIPGVSESKITWYRSAAASVALVQSVYKRRASSFRRILSWFPRCDCCKTKQEWANRAVLQPSVHRSHTSRAEASRLLSGFKFGWFKRRKNVLVDESRRNGDCVRIISTRNTVSSSVVSKTRRQRSHVDGFHVSVVEGSIRSRRRSTQRGQQQSARPTEGERRTQPGFNGLSGSRCRCVLQAKVGDRRDAPYTRVTSIQSVGVQAVWDITVEDDHSYVAQGLVHHNSSDGPNLQNMPKRKNEQIRSQIVAPAGHALIAADFGQIEARLIGVASEDEFLMESLFTDYDIHMYWAKRVVDYHPGVYKALELEEGNIKALRSEIKNMLVFPAFYGAKPPSIAISLRMKKESCEELFGEFWDQFKGVKKWQLRLQEFYRKHGYVECLTGRRRHGPLSVNQICNSPIQGTASDIVVDAMDRLSEISQNEGKEHLQAAINIHDDLTFWVPEETVDESIERIVREMLSCPFPWITVPLSVEVAVGTDWFRMNKIGSFRSDQLGEAA